MIYDYEQSIWGKGEASLAWSNPTSFRLRSALKALRALPDGAKVLELGCGAGQFIRAIKKMRPELGCLGSDISQTAVSLASKKQDGVRYVLNNDKLPFGDASLDAVLIFDVLEHVVNPAAILTEVHRVLKSGGLLYAFVPCEGDFLSMWHCLRLFGIGLEVTQKNAGHIQYFSRSRLLQLVENSGLSKKTVWYSEHILGQLLGVAAFFAMDQARKKQALTQINNETYFEQKTSLGVRILKIVINSLIYLESVIFSKAPSPNVHVVAVKNDAL